VNTKTKRDKPRVKNALQTITPINPNKQHASHVSQGQLPQMVPPFVQPVGRAGLWMRQNTARVVKSVDIPTNLNKPNARNATLDKHQRTKVKRIVPNAKQDDTWIKHWNAKSVPLADSPTEVGNPIVPIVLRPKRRRLVLRFALNAKPVLLWMQQSNAYSVKLVNIPINVDKNNARHVPLDKHQKTKVKRIVPNAKRVDTWTKHWSVQSVPLADSPTEVGNTIVPTAPPKKRRRLVLRTAPSVMLEHSWTPRKIVKRAPSVKSVHLVKTIARLAWLAFTPAPTNPPVILAVQESFPIVLFKHPPVPVKIAKKVNTLPPLE
jgi:hypothetical protein